MRANRTFRKGDRVRLSRDARRRARSFYTDAHRGCGGPAEVIDHIGDHTLVVRFDEGKGIGIHHPDDLRPARW